MRISGSSKHLLRLVLLLSVMVFVMLPAAAFAQTDGVDEYPTTPTTPTTEVRGTVVTKAVDSASSSLPVTGGDVAVLTVLGLGAVGAGVAIVALGRRRSTPST